MSSNLVGTTSDLVLRRHFKLDLTILNGRIRVVEAGSGEDSEGNKFEWDHSVKIYSENEYQVDKINENDSTGYDEEVCTKISCSNIHEARVLAKNIQKLFLDKKPLVLKDCAIPRFSVKTKEYTVNILDFDSSNLKK